MNTLCRLHRPRQVASFGPPIFDSQLTSTKWFGNIDFPGDEDYTEYWWLFPIVCKPWNCAAGKEGLFFAKGWAFLHGFYRILFQCVLDETLGPKWQNLRRASVYRKLPGSERDRLAQDGEPTCRELCVPQSTRQATIALPVHNLLKIPIVITRTNSFCRETIIIPWVWGSFSFFELGNGLYTHSLLHMWVSPKSPLFSTMNRFKGPNSRREFISSLPPHG